MPARNFKEILKDKMDTYVHLISKKFPRVEQYGVTSQIRRAALSVILNYVEGYARRRPAVQLNFLEISYGSLKESEYLLRFCEAEGFINKDDCASISKVANEIGAMLWTEIHALEKSLKS